MAKKDSQEPQSAPIREGYVRIIIHNSQGEDGNNDVFLSDGQGKQWVAKRETEIGVPAGVLDILNNARIETYSTDESGSIREAHTQRRFGVTVLERG